MEIVTTRCCAIMEIDKLSRHTTPEEAMAEFCKLTIVTQPLFGTARNIPVAGSQYAFYLFTAACDKNGESLYKGVGYRAYGKEFAEFIKENGLGKVWASPPKHNEVFHPDHHNQVWVWDVDNEALKAWWTKFQAKPKVKVPPSAKKSLV